MTLRLRGSTSGYAEINAPAVAGDNSLTLPTTAGTIRTTSPSGVDGDYTVGTGATIRGGTNLIRFDTGVTNPVQVDSNGHVGIGTDNNTSAALDVHGDIRISRGSRGDGTGKIMFGSDSGDYLQLQDIGTGGNIFELVQDGSKKVVVRGTNGNVGIGTDIPTSNLHIDGTVRSNEGYTVYPPSDSNYAFATRNAANDQWTAFIEASGKATFAGNVVLSTSGSGIDFSATGGAGGTNNAVIGSENELFNDYEYGYWTPTVSSGSNPSSTLTVQRGQYVKIGRQVTVYAYVTFVGGDGGVFRLTNMPYTGDVTTNQTTGQNSAGSDGTEAVGSVLFNNLNMSGMTNLVAYHRGEIVYFYYTLGNDGATWTEITGAQVGGNSGGGGLIFNFTYFTNG